MKINTLNIHHIPCLLWGEPSNKIILYVHGKGASKDGSLAKLLANIVVKKGYQCLSFDLPEHGERTDHRRCDVFDGVEDLKCVFHFLQENYSEISVFACSIGAYFTLQALKYENVSECFFLSPVIDMEYLISQMFLWFSVTEERLQQEKEIHTPVDPLRYDYYCYVKEHPLIEWKIPTKILFGIHDNLQTLEIMNNFKEKYYADLTVSKSSDHAFLTKEDHQMIREWLEKNIT